MRKGGSRAAARERPESGSPRMGMVGDTGRREMTRDLDNLRVVLASTRNPLNIGAAARAMSNLECGNCGW